MSGQIIRVGGHFVGGEGDVLMSGFGSCVTLLPFMTAAMPRFISKTHSFTNPHHFICFIVPSTTHMFELEPGDASWRDNSRESHCSGYDIFYCKNASLSNNSMQADDSGSQTKERSAHQYDVILGLALFP